MIALDTNVIVRLLVQDDEEQFRATSKLLSRKGAKFFASDLVLIELDWVLRKLYNWAPEEVIEALYQMIAIRNLVFEDEQRLLAVLEAMKKGSGMADELIAAVAKRHGCRELASFDRTLAKKHAGFVLVPKS